jgi:hypothetical protein
MNPNRQTPKRIIAKELGMLLLAAVVVISALLFASRVRGDSPPFTPLNDNVTSATVVSAQATTAAADQAEQDAQATAQANIGLPSSKTLYPSPPPDSPSDVATVEAQTIPIPTGISNPMTLPGGWGSLYQITNMWFGIINGNRVAVTAGSKFDNPAGSVESNPAQGVVIVESDAFTIPGRKEFLTPTRNGTIKITSYSGTCLTLQTTGSSVTNYYFNAATLAWSCP